MTLDTETRAYIGPNADVSADGNVAVAAVSDADVWNTAGGIAVTTGAVGIGVSAATVTKNDTTEAYIGTGATVNALGTAGTTTLVDGQEITGVAVHAVSNEEFNSIVVAAGVSTKTAGIAGQAGIHVLNETTHAYIAENAQINQANPTSSPNSGQSVSVYAKDSTNIMSVGGGLAFGSSVGIGAGADVGTMTKDTQAWIGSGADVRAERDIRVQSSSDERLISAAAGLAGSKTVAVAGAVGVYVMDVTTKAFVEGSKVGYGGATLHAGGSVQVAAQAANEADSFSGNVAGSGTAAVGGAIIVPVVTKNTFAFIGDDAVVDALARRDGIDVHTGKFNVTFTSYGDMADGEVSPVDISQSDVMDDSDELNQPNPLVDEQLTGQRVATPETVTGFKGVAVTAVNQDDIASYALGAAASGKVAVQVSANVNVMTSNTYAYLGNRVQVNAADVSEHTSQSVLIGAGNDYQHLSVAGGAAIAGAVGVTPGVDLSVVNNTVRAYVGDDAVVEAQEDVFVRAHSREDVLAIAIAIAGGGAVGVGGAVAVLALDSDTQAYISDGASVRADGNLLVNAVDHTDVDIVATALGIGIGAAGIGAGIGVSVVDKMTKAWIGDATIDAKGNSLINMTVFDGTLDDAGTFGVTDSADGVRGVAVIAESTEDILSIAVAGGASTGVGIAGAVTAEILNADTQAYIAGGAVVNADPTGAHANQDVHVSAINEVTTLAVSGAAGVGTAGLAGGVDVGMIRNDTTAYIAGNVSANRDVRVHALTNREIDSYTISAGGGAAGLGAAASIYALSGDLVQSYSFSDSGTQKNKNALQGSDGDILTLLDSLLNADNVLEVLDGFSPTADYTTEDSAQTVATGQQVRIADSYSDESIRGKLFEYVGETDRQVTNWESEDFGNTDVWVEIIEDQAMADVTSSADGSVTTASEDSSLDVSSQTTTTSTSSIPPGTVAFLGIGSTVTAGRHVDVDAQPRRPAAGSRRPGCWWRGSWRGNWHSERRSQRQGVCGKRRNDHGRRHGCQRRFHARRRFECRLSGHRRDRWLWSVPRCGRRGHRGQRHERCGGVSR